MRSVTVNTSKDYSVLIDGNIDGSAEGLLSQAGERIAAACGGTAAALVTDDIVNKLYGDTVEKSLRAAGYAVTRFVFPHGEKSKNTDVYVSLLCALAQANLTRSDVVVALGGGVTGDMAGFAAATYLRGIRFVQIPTTLLAMVDSSVGGKTGVDLPAGKNLAGAFFQPDLVLCDVQTLQTLPDEVFHDGCAEMIKHGVILSAELFELLKEPIRQRMEDVIARNVTIKRDIVTADEKETGIRRILNFGHTIGHGIEKHSNYGVTHGKAVAAGMVIASRGAARMGLCGEDCHREIAQAVRRYQLPADTDIPPDKLIEAAFFDKKRSGQSITLILPEKIGKCAAKSFSLDDLAAFIRLGMRA
jgi:3-dehydroquinate synthase